MLLTVLYSDVLVEIGVKCLFLQTSEAEMLIKTRWGRSNEYPHLASSSSVPRRFSVLSSGRRRLVGKTLGFLPMILVRELLAYWALGRGQYSGANDAQVSPKEEPASMALQSCLLLEVEGEPSLPILSV